VRMIDRLLRKMVSGIDMVSGGRLTKRILRKMSNGVDMVSIGLYGCLYRRFKSKYGDKANYLAAAVANELFSQQPSTPDAKNFLELHKELIEKEIHNLQNDDEIRTMVTQAVRVMCITSPELSFYPIEKLREFGILIPGGDSPSPETFLPMAYEFYQRGKMEWECYHNQLTKNKLGD